MIHLGLIGWPLGHSLSPQLHAAAFQDTGLEGVYSLYPVSPDDSRALAEVLNQLRSGDLQGLNVTIPHKQAVMPLLDKLTPEAEAIGAVNTISVDGERLVGHNTDAPGFQADLARNLKVDDGQNKALVLGAGGSARAVCYALIQGGWDLIVAARKLEQAEALVRDMKSSIGTSEKIEHGLRRSNRFSRKVKKNPRESAQSAEIHVPYKTLYAKWLDASDLEHSLEGLNLVVNTTPVGMSPKDGFSPWPVGLAFPKDALVYDLVYNPRRTLLLRRAKAAGLSTASGIGMLVEQAALAFEIWTGRAPSREAMSAALEEA